MSLPADSYRPRLTDSRLANLGAECVHNGFLDYCGQFQAITRRAKLRFEQRDWPGRRADAWERLELYRQIVDVTEGSVRTLLDDRLGDKLVWASMKAVYSGLIAHRDDWEIAETFYNSITRRIFTTVGVDSQIEFVTTDFETPPTPPAGVVYHSYTCEDGLLSALAGIVASYDFAAPFACLEEDLRLATAEVEARLQAAGSPPITRIDMACEPFFRVKAAYLIGRIAAGQETIPLVFALLHEPAGIIIDSVLLDESSISILFSFARSYFHVRTERPYDLVQFISTLIPRKRLAEIYISLGYNKHGKTVLYRDILTHLSRSPERFQIAPGTRGMVMTVFHMPDYDLVFKLIKDRFAHPKRTTRAEVMQKYELVFKHERAGRLVDAQEFEHLKFGRERFDPDLLAELQRVASRTVTVDEAHVVVHHAYVERRVTPLDIFVYTAGEAEAKAAVLDYGQAIKDLAQSNIFPGDLLLKNFGVTRRGRVVFYDYDELRPLTACHFRRFPQARHPDDELAAQPWFHVNEDDIFPEEFPHFMALPRHLEPIFRQHHGDLFDIDFWRENQRRIEEGEWIHIRPYPKSRCLQK